MPVGGDVVLGELYTALEVRGPVATFRDELLRGIDLLEVGFVIDLDGGILMNVFVDDVRLDELCRQVVLGIAEIGGLVGLHIPMGTGLDRLEA